jgi:NADPH-dependent glutamate synthase beta subunit-like oxidoreductase/ferredoxin
VKLTIDNKVLECEGDLSLMEAARRLGIEIPALCYTEGYDYFTSCMMCMVKDKKSGKTLPACSARAADGMEIETQSADIRAFRKSTLELLLSDHLGDCEAPCQRLCGVHNEVPQIIRDIKAGEMNAAVAHLRSDMALPGVLERFCNAPCEKGCRRGLVDESVSIRALMRHAAEWDIKNTEPHVPPCAPSSGKRVAIIGAGMTGLSTAYYLALLGHASVVYERQSRVLPRLRAEHSTDVLPDWVVEGELRLLNRLGIDIRTGVKVGADIAMEEIRGQFSAVVVACGAVPVAELEALGVPGTAKGVIADANTSKTKIEGVFSAGSAVKRETPILKTVQQAKAMAACISQALNQKEMVGIVEIYNHAMGRLQPVELREFASHASPIPRVRSADQGQVAYSEEAALQETGRCMHCDCRANHNCKLRTYSDEYDAVQSAYKGEERATYVQVNRDTGVLYEPGKCVKCGLCVRVTKKDGEKFGFTFVGRGFEVKAAISLGKSLEEGLEKTAGKVVEACPTGALANADD